MVVFIDTSSLIKQYLQEEGTDAFEEFVKTAKKIIVSPITWIEANSALVRKLTEKAITENEFKRIKRRMKKDFKFFRIIKWNDTLENKAVKYIKKHQLKPLDAIQLASAVSVKNIIKYFIGSDEKLNMACEEENLKVFDPVKN